MIAFDLQCAQGHNFEGWFKDEKSYKKQQKKGLVTCPVCNDTEVVRIPSSFGIIKSNPGSNQNFSEQKLAIANINNKIVDFIENNFDNVGTDFTKEALKIHYGVSEPRNIRGTSTKKEEKLLKEEGVSIFKVPIPEKEPEPDA